MAYQSEDEKLIIKFLDKSISRDELGIFKKRYESDLPFAKLYHQQKEVFDALNLAGKSISSQEVQFRYFLKTNSIPFVLGIISLLFSLAIGYFGFNEADAPTLAYSKLETRRIEVLTVRSSNSLPAAEKSPEEKMEEYQFQVAIHPQHARLHFILADLYLQNGFPDSAKKYYHSGLSLDYEDSFAQWNLLLSHLYTYDMDSVNTYLNKFIEGDNPYLHQKALELQAETQSIDFLYNLKNLAH